MRIKERDLENKNINTESEESIKSYLQKRILMNIKLHKIFLFICIIIDIILIGFIIFYKKKIIEVREISNLYRTELLIEEKKVSKNRKILDHRLVNVAAFSKRGNFRCSMLLEKLEELNMIKQLISNFYDVETNFTANVDKMRSVLLFQSVSDNGNIISLYENIMYYDHLVILLSTNNGKKMGIYLENTIIPDDNDEFINDNKNVFIFSFETKKYYKFKGEGNSFYINKNKLTIGKDDIIIYDEFIKKGGIINFPFSSFDTSGINLNVFTEKDGEFNIITLEAFCFA